MKVQNQYKVVHNNNVTKGSKKKEADQIPFLPQREEVDLSESASFVQSLRSTAEGTDPDEVRSDVVEQSKADIRDGKLGSKEDYEQSITALLMEADNDDI